MDDHKTTSGHQTRTTMRRNSDDCSYEYMHVLRDVPYYSQKRHLEIGSDPSVVLYELATSHMASDTPTDVSLSTFLFFLAPKFLIIFANIRAGIKG